MVGSRPCPEYTPPVLRFRTAAIALATGLFAPSVARAQEATPADVPKDDPVARLESRLDAQEKELAALRAELAQREARRAERARAPRPTFERRGKREIEVSGYVQAEWTVFRQSSQDDVYVPTASPNQATLQGLNPAEPLNEDRFLLRRARIRVDSDRGLFYGAVEMDANTVRGPQVRPTNVEASIKWPSTLDYPAATSDERTPTDAPWFVVTAGMFRTPFGFEVTEGTKRRAWLERSTFANALFPQSFDLGLRVLGGYRFVNYALGVMNGEPIGERTFPGRDPNKSKDLMFRLGAVTRVTDTITVAGGVSGLTGRGFHRGNPTTKDQLVWRDTNEDTVVQQTELSVIPGGPATPSEGFSRFAVGADLRVTVGIGRLGDLALRGEIVRAKNLDRGLYVADPVAATRDLREFGYYVGASQELTKWAIVGVRYDRYDPDADAREQQAFAVVPVDQSLSTWSFMAAGRFGSAKLVAQYDRRKNALGRDETGKPATLADDSFTLRAEVRF